MNYRILKMYQLSNGSYISRKISKDKLMELGENYFNILLIKNKNKQNVFDSDYFLIINGDKNAVRSR